MSEDFQSPFENEEFGRALGTHFDDIVRHHINRLGEQSPSEEDFKLNARVVTKHGCRYSILVWKTTPLLKIYDFEYSLHPHVWASRKIEAIQK